MRKTAILKYDRNLDIVTGYHQPCTQLLSACYEPTNICKGGCPYCLIEYKKSETELEKSLAVLKSLIQKGILRIGFGGGEPLECSYIYNLGAYVREAGIGSLLRSSGMYPINPSQCRASFDWVDISLDSINPTIMKKARPGVDLNTLLSNIVNLSSNGIRIRVSILVSQINLNFIEDTIRWLAANGVLSVRFQEVVPRGRARTGWKELSIPGRTYKENIGDYLDLCDSLGISGKSLSSIKGKTLLIVKPDGDMFIGSPDGIHLLGRVEDDSCWTSALSHIGKAQVRQYFRLL